MLQTYPVERSEHSGLCPFAAGLSGLKILLVEDTTDLRMLYSRALQRAGAHTICASNAKEAWSFIGAKRPDLIICDIGLPDEDGMSFIRRVRIAEDGLGYTTPAVAVTAFTNLKDDILRSGFDGFAPKPVTGLELVTVITAVWNQKRSQSPLMGNRCLSN